MDKIFDYIIITVSSEFQQKILEIELENRKLNKLIPVDTKYIIIKENERIGSGGAIFNLIKIFYNDKSFFCNKILLINSAGESTRQVLYADKGKVIIPTFNNKTNSKNNSENMKTSILLDEILKETKEIGKNMDNGILIVSGDCTTIYKEFPNKVIKENTLISVKANMELGKNHGVFVIEQGKLKESLQKQSIEILRSKGAIDANNEISIDTGIIFFDTKTIYDISKIITKNNEIDEEIFKRIVNKNVKLNVYTDFIYPLSKTAQKEKYLSQKPELEINENLLFAREKLWEVLNNKIFNVLQIQGKFIHYGTVKEFIEHAFEKRQTENIIINSEISKDAKLMGKNYIENSKIIGKCRIGKNSIIVDSTIHDCDVPDDVIIKSDVKYVKK